MKPAPENGSQPRRFRKVTLLVLATITIVGGGYAVFWRYHLKRFQVVAPGTFYRVAQPTEVGLEHLVRRHGIKTVVSLQLFDSRLHRGWYDFDKPDGAKESEFVRSLGANAVQWRMGDEICWPWPNAWELEEFFHLIDNPDNRPVVIHCMGGRHRTGTLSALYRIEYDRWTADQAIEEMHSFSFGGKIIVQDVNLRTYCPRPLPSDDEWPAIAKLFGVSAAEKPAESVPVLVHRIRQARADDELRRSFDEFAVSEHRYALPLAARVVSDASDPILPALLSKARKLLASDEESDVQTAAAATLIADFGSGNDQELLLDTLRRESKASTPSTRYEGLVRGVTNRYTANRLPYLRPLLDDPRSRLAPYSDHTYRGTAACRVAAISDAISSLQWNDGNLQTDAVNAAIAWIEKQPDALKLVQLVAPGGRRDVDDGDGTNKEDLSKMRR